MIFKPAVLFPDFSTSDESVERGGGSTTNLQNIPPLFTTCAFAGLFAVPERSIRARRWEPRLGVCFRQRLP